MLSLRELDAVKERLISLFPGWRVWFVPHGSGSGLTHVVWCAQPEPLLNCGSPGELAEAMSAADARRARPGSVPRHRDEAAEAADQ